MSVPPREHRPVEYTYDWYGTMLSGLGESGYRFGEFDDDPEPGDVFLRHDVDWSPRAAVEMARVEAEHDATATYFFLVTSPFYNLLSAQNRERVREIERLGHTVGLHFAAAELWETEPTSAEMTARVAEHKQVLPAVADDPTETVAFHNPPEWALNRRYDAFVNTYEPRFFSEIGYESDSLGRWRTEPPLADETPEALQILTHPTLWGPTDEPPTVRIRDQQRSYLQETDAQMREHSRLDWEFGAQIRPE